MEDNEKKVAEAAEEQIQEAGQAKQVVADKTDETAQPVYGWRSATASAEPVEAASETAEVVEHASVEAEADVAETETDAATIAEEAESAVDAAADTAETVEEAVEETAAVTEKASEAPQGEPEPKPKFKVKPWMWAIAAAVVVIVIGVVAFTTNQAKTYDQAVEDFAAGKYEQAAEGFKALGNYQDAPSMYEKASQWVNAQAAKEAAKDKEDASLWTAAAEAYGAIDDWSAQEEAKKCSGNADYYTAKGMLAKSPTDRKTVTDALPLFKNCTEIADAATQVSYCEDVIDYYKAGDMAAEGHFYDAYKAYGKIGKAAADKLGDVDKKRDACIQSLPGNGVVWRNPDAPSDSCQLTIVNSGNPNAYYKIYMADALTLTVFIAAGESATFSLPSGTFSMNKGYGDTWFGPDDMFGDEGNYFICDFGGSKTFDLESGGMYEISTSGQGTGIGSKSAGRGAI